MFKRLMVVFVLLVVGIMSVPTMSEAGLFTKTTKYDVLAKNQDVIDIAEHWETNNPKSNSAATILRYLKFIARETPSEFLNAVKSAGTTDPDVIAFTEMHPNITHGAVLQGLSEVLSNPQYANTPLFRFEVAIRAYTLRSDVESEYQEKESLMFTGKGTLPFVLIENGRAPQKLHDLAKGILDAYLKNSKK